MTGDGPIYWDACIFIAHLKSEQRADPLDMLGVEGQVQYIDNGDLDLVTSTVCLVEVLECTLTQDAYNKFKTYFSRRNIHLVDVSKEIALIAHEIRDFYQKQNDGLPTVTTADAIHIATAISFGCSKFYTFDENDQKNKRRALIPLAQPIAGKYPIPIEKPVPNTTQLPLNFGAH